MHNPGVKHIPPQIMMALFKRLSFQVCIILILGAAIGILANTFSNSPIPWIRLSKDIENGQWKQVSVEEAAELFNDGLALFIDAREAKEFNIGHIPGAINLPAEEFQEYYQVPPSDKSLGYFRTPSGQNENSPDIHVWAP